MEFKTSQVFDSSTFAKLQQRLKDFSQTRRGLLKDPLYHTKYPTELNYQLTYACNLRCKMCYQWSEDGYFQSYNKTALNHEISVDLFEKGLYETKEAQSRLYMWGGEPLFHSDWSSIANALYKDPRYTIMCTNGMLIEKNMEAIEKISPYLVMLLSIDGPDEIHNSLRGKRTFERLIKQMDLLLDEQRKGNYKGEVSINIVLHDELVPILYEFLEYLEDRGVNSVYLNYPWYISKDRANAMDQFYNEHLSWLGEIQPGTASWHSFTFRLSDNSKELLQSQIEKMNKRVWRMRVRFQQNIETYNIGPFIDDSYVTTRHCLAIASRIEILADGRVGICSKFFPELSIGSFHDDTLLNIWHSERFMKLRRVIAKGLMPVCSKCVLLYRNGI